MHMILPEDNNHAAIPMRSATTGSQAMHRIIHIGITTQCRIQRRNALRSERPQPHPPHTRGALHRRLQPLYTIEYTVSCSRFLPNTSPKQDLCSHYKVTISENYHFLSSRYSFVTASHRHHFPSSPLPFVTTSLNHHFPSSPYSFRIISQNHRTPFVITSLRYHFPKSPHSLRHHFPKLPHPLSPLPFVTTSSPFPKITLPLGHHCPSSPPCVIAHPVS